VNDYFAQAVIDYILGRATDTIFAEFEADMKSSDYFIDLRKVRQAAIERSAGIVIEDKDEDLIHGWTLSTPTSANALKTTTFEEAVLLLTEKALYFCRLDWGTEKVREFERIALENVDDVAKGVYITSTLAQRHMDAEKNVGFVIRYKADLGAELVRRNTRSLDSGNSEGEKAGRGQSGKKQENLGRFLAFKALPPRSSVTSSSSSDTDVPESEAEVVKSICDEVVRIANKSRRADAVKWNVPGQEGDAGKKEEMQKAGDEAGHTMKDLEVEEKDIISLADAKKSTGYLEQIGYSLKKMVWA
jgi:hypothetical protein